MCVMLKENPRSHIPQEDVSHTLFAIRTGEVRRPGNSFNTAFVPDLLGFFLLSWR